ncbi:hypothetical protein [Paenimyroides ceti]
MTHDEIWKNFSLGTELTISGNFIFNGLQTLDLIEHLYYQDEPFEFFYNISVGIERLQKITLILKEHTKYIDQIEFEKSLITHNHSQLHSRLKKSYNINFGKNHIDFLSCLSKFYKSHRYGNFAFSNLSSNDKPNILLAEFIKKHLGVSIKMKFHDCTYLEDNVKKFISKTIGKICEEYYKLIILECDKLNLYTYEVGTHSKAFKVFISKKYDFFEEKNIQKEIIKYLVKGKLSNKFNEYLNKEPPLEFDFYDVNYLISYLMLPSKKFCVKGEVDELYSELSNAKSRINHLNLIGDRDIEFRD